MFGAVNDYVDGSGDPGGVFISSSDDEKLDL
jgi:hypothetical protein